MSEICLYISLFVDLCVNRNKKNKLTSIGQSYKIEIIYVSLQFRVNFIFSLARLLSNQAELETVKTPGFKIDIAHPRENKIRSRIAHPFLEKLWTL